MKIIYQVFLLIIVSFQVLASGNSLLENEQNTIKVFKENNDSIVNVSNIQIYRRHSFFGTRSTEVPKGAGTGFVWNDKGYIVTNFHVIRGGDSFIVNFPHDKKQYKAKIAGVAPEKDIAVLKVINPPRNLNPVSVGKSSNLQVGQKAIAIGNPFGLDSTLTTGVISALGRTIQGVSGLDIADMIQTDASINPGNSGGPLLNSKGEVIGMNTVIISPSGSSAGVGFAVPVDAITRIVPQLIKHGKVIRPGLGIGLLTPGQQYRLGVREGIVIGSILNEKSGAAKAGLQGLEQDSLGRISLGDVILEVDGKKVNSHNDIYQVLDKKNMGDVVKVKFKRGRKIKTVKVTLNRVEP